jgi:hypothetical protein
MVKLVWDEGFDRRPYAGKVAADKGWDLVVEDNTGIEQYTNLQTRSLETLASKIYEEARDQANPYIVGVTGSVGKTTTVAFLEHMIRTSGVEVTRFYSKRLTPLSVMCHYINRVEADTPFIVMEYSAYMSQHVAELSHLLPPNIAFLMNIYETHINPGMFENKNDIFNSKVKIKPNNALGLINQRVLNELDIPIPIGWNNFEVEVPEGYNPNLPPTLRTAEMYTVAKLLADEIGIPLEVLIQAYQSFTPQEKRILPCNYKGKNIFFHGETSGGSRLWSWFETVDGSIPWLLVEEIDFADEDPSGFKDLLTNVFDSDKTFVLDTPTNRKRLPVNAKFVSEIVFRGLLENKVNGYVVYHKALATRKAGFEPTDHLKGKWQLAK